MENETTASGKKRDRMEIVADILSLCTTPQTRTAIKRQTSIPYSVLQNCITQLLTQKWLELIEEELTPKLTVTMKGLIFLEKWFELQKVVGVKNNYKLTKRSFRAKAVIPQ